VRKRYQATVTPPLESAELERLIEGVDLEDGPARALSASVLRRDQRGEVIEVEMVEGRKREVRRLFRALGAEVVDLVRTRVGPIALAGLPEGRWRELAGDELTRLYAAAGLPAPAGVATP
jgi:pseudouridine synthase